MQIDHVQADHYVIPLATALSDSTHGTIRGFKLVTVRVRDADGAMGVGYTYTGGAAVHALIARDLTPRLIGREAERIEEIWQAMWWALHYGGRGGAAALAISAVDIALWDLRGRRQKTPLWRMLGGFDPRVPCYAGGIDLDLSRSCSRPTTTSREASGPSEAHGFGLDRFIAEPLCLEAGAAVAPDRPGHGVDFDWKALDAPPAPR